jgi:para-aminobenzoate synthetase/4-amino-4-deoxychorismate lyase
MPTDHSDPHAPRDFQLLESLRWDPGAGYPLLEDHLARLAGSARHFGFALDEARVRAELARAGRAVTGGVHKVRLRVGRGGEVTVESERIVPPTAPLRVAVAPDPVDPRDPMLYHKTTERQVYRSRLASRPDCDEVLLINRRGELTEATTANLVVLLDGALWTPPLDAGLLPGVMRARLLARGELRERRLTPADLERARAVYLINSVRGWREAMLAAP